MEYNISYQPCKFQLSRMSGSNFTEGGVENTPLSAAPGGKSPVLLGLMQKIKQRAYFISRDLRYDIMLVISHTKCTVTKPAVCFSA